MNPATYSSHMSRYYPDATYNGSTSYIKQKFDSFTKKIKVKYMAKNHRSFTDLRSQRSLPIPKYHENPIGELARLDSLYFGTQPISSSPTTKPYPDPWKETEALHCLDTPVQLETNGEVLNNATIHTHKTMEGSPPSYKPKGDDLSNSSLNNFYDNDITSPEPLVNHNIMPKTAVSPGMEIDVAKDGWFKDLTESRATMDSNYFSYNGSLDIKSISATSHTSTAKPDLKPIGTSIPPKPTSMIVDPPRILKKSQSLWFDPINSRMGRRSKESKDDSVNTVPLTTVIKDTFLIPYFQSGHIIKIHPYLYMGDLESAYCEQVLCKLNIEGLIDVSGMCEKEAEAYLQCKIGWGSTVFRSCTCPRQTSHNRAKLRVNLSYTNKPSEDSLIDSRLNNHNHHPAFSFKLRSGSTTNASAAAHRRDDERGERESIIAYFRDINKFLDHYKDTGKRILVFCKDGRSGAPAIIVQHLMHSYGMSLRRAYNLLKRLCPATEPKLKIENALQVTLFRYERILVRDNMILPMMIKPSVTEEAMSGRDGCQRYKHVLTNSQSYQTNHGDGRGRNSGLLLNVPIGNDWFGNGDTGSGEFLEGIMTDGMEGFGMSNFRNHLLNNDKQYYDYSNFKSGHYPKKSPEPRRDFTPTTNQDVLSIPLTRTTIKTRVFEKVEDSGCYILDGDYDS